MPFSFTVKLIELEANTNHRCYLLLSCLPTSHTTVHAVPHTAVPILDAIQDMNPSALDSPHRATSVTKRQGALLESH